MDELTQSIGEKGILQPITVMENKNNSYTIIAGERRYRAAKKLGSALGPNAVNQLLEYIIKRENKGTEYKIMLNGVNQTKFKAYSLQATSLNLLLKRDDVIIHSICDIDQLAIDSSRELFTKHNKKHPKIFKKDKYSYQDLLEQKQIDGVIISTPWRWHFKMAIN